MDSSKSLFFQLILNILHGVNVMRFHDNWLMGVVDYWGSYFGKYTRIKTFQWNSLTFPLRLHEPKLFSGEHLQDLHFLSCLRVPSGHISHARPKAPFWQLEQTTVFWNKTLKCCAIKILWCIQYFTIISKNVIKNIVLIHKTQYLIGNKELILFFNSTDL